MHKDVAQWVADFLVCQEINKTFMDFISGHTNSRGYEAYGSLLIGSVRIHIL